MKILGWIRYGDQAACGGQVVEGCSTTESHGRRMAFYGARLACRKNCVIAEAHPNVTLPNGRNVPHHGHITTGGCPLISTLNDVHGWTNERGAEIPPAFVPDGEGGWKGIHPPPQEHDQIHDEYFILMDEKSATPARNRFYRITLDTGETIEG